MFPGEPDKSESSLGTGILTSSREPGTQQTLNEYLWNGLKVNFNDKEIFRS